jgi:hypothetical protein
MKRQGRRWYANWYGRAAYRRRTKAQYAAMISAADRKPAAAVRLSTWRSETSISTSMKGRAYQGMSAATWSSALLLLGYALLRLDRMLQACAAGQMFALRTVGHMKAFAAGLLGALTLTVIEPLLRAGLWRLGFGGPLRPVNVGVSSEELMLVLICALFFVVASMMHEARRIAEDNEGFV